MKIDNQIELITRKYFNKCEWKTVFLFMHIVVLSSPIFASKPLYFFDIFVVSRGHRLQRSSVVFATKIQFLISIGFLWWQIERRLIHLRRSIILNIFSEWKSIGGKCTWIKVKIIWTYCSFHLIPFKLKFFSSIIFFQNFQMSSSIFPWKFLFIKKPRNCRREL